MSELLFLRPPVQEPQAHAPDAGVLHSCKSSAGLWHYANIIVIVVGKTDIVCSGACPCVSVCGVGLFVRAKAIDLKLMQLFASRYCRQQIKIKFFVAFCVQTVLSTSCLYTHLNMLYCALFSY